MTNLTVLPHRVLEKPIPEDGRALLDIELARLNLLGVAVPAGALILRDDPRGKVGRLHALAADGLRHTQLRVVSR